MLSLLVRPLTQPLRKKQPANHTFHYSGADTRAETDSCNEPKNGPTVGHSVDERPTDTAVYEASSRNSIGQNHRNPRRAVA